jgi:hypothetical protein
MIKTLSLFILLLPLLLTAEAHAERSLGQTIYVPCYSHIYHGPKSRPLDLTVILSVRNTDMHLPLTLTLVDYYDTSGTLVRHKLDKPMLITPLMTVEFMVHQRDTTGGSGANFIVTWSAEEPVNTPIVEAVMISTESSLGVSFRSSGKVLDE